MHIVCSDLEGVFVPEIWINVAKKTGIEELKLTTRDISDYDVLMRRRLAILDENGIRIDDIKQVIASIDPLEGAVDFLDWLRACTQIIVVSDTFTQFAGPLMEKLKWPTLFCNTLTIEPDGRISGYELRQKNGKHKVMVALKSLNYKTIAFGDSYNDIDMIKEADTGMLFCPPDNVKEEHPGLSVHYDYDGLKSAIIQIIEGNP